MRYQSRPAATAALILSAAISQLGCVVNGWHEENFHDRLTLLAKSPSDAVEQQNNLLRELPTVGLQRIENKGFPVTEARFIRSYEDRNHVNVCIKTLKLVDRPEWATVIDVESYAIGREGAILSGKAMLKEVAELAKGDPGLMGATIVPAPATAPATPPANP